MNVLQILPNCIFVESEVDLNFIKNEIKLSGQKINNLKIGDVVFLNQDNIYVVKPLDTIESIAKKLNINKDELIKKVGGKNIFIGQRINLNS